MPNDKEKLIVNLERLNCVGVVATRLGVLRVLGAALAFPFRGLLSWFLRRYAQLDARRNTASHFDLGRMHVAGLCGGVEALSHLLIFSRHA